MAGAGLRQQRLAGGTVVGTGGVAFSAGQLANSGGPLALTYDFPGGRGRMPRIPGDILINA